MKTRKSTLVLSILATLVCVTMLIGTTFAWFTDTATTNVNTIQAGTLDVQLLGVDNVDLEGQTLEFMKAEGDAAVLWEPGCTYRLPNMYVKNNGNLALKYKLVVTGITGDAKLLEVIDFAIINDDLMPVPLSDFEGYLGAGETSAAYYFEGHMAEDAGNEYQDLKLEGIAITVVATQDAVEFDSYDNQYDAAATYPVSDAAEFIDAMAEVEDGDVVELLGEIALEAPLTINNNITIEGNGNTIISGAPVYIAPANEVTINEVVFDRPVSAKNTASILYANGLAGEIVLNGCVFQDTQWDSLQITPVDGANIEIVNCKFISTEDAFHYHGDTPTSGSHRFIHIEAADNAVVTVKIVGNTFDNIDTCICDDGITIWNVPFANIIVGKNVFVNSTAEEATAELWIAIPGSPYDIFDQADAYTKLIADAEAPLA